MTKTGSRLVVRQHSPRRSALVVAGVVALLAGAGYALYEYGRSEGGYDHIAAAREAGQLTERITELEKDNTGLRERIAMLETSREIDKEAYQQVEQNLLELQELLQKQREDLAFYRGIVLPRDGVAGLRIQRFEVVPGAESSLYRLKLVLVQALKHDTVVSGVVNLSVSGARDGEPVSYPLNELAPSGGVKTASLKFRFRYFQDLEQEVVLPDGFLPDRVHVEVLPARRSGQILRESFEWEA